MSRVTGCRKTTSFDRPVAVIDSRIVCYVPRASSSRADLKRSDKWHRWLADRIVSPAPDHWLAANAKNSWSTLSRWPYHCLTRYPSLVTGHFGMLDSSLVTRHSSLFLNGYHE